MKRTSLTLAVAAVVLFTSSSAAQSSRAVTVGISAGAAIPTGDFSDVYNTGFNGTVSLGFNSVGTPLGFRVDGMYNKFGERDDLIVPRPDYTIIGANANLVYSLPGQGIRPYLIGGGGIYGQKPDVSGAETTTDFGVNGGIGAAFPLSGFNTFIEARLHHIFSDVSTQFIPITFGISF
ncbi:MAG: outer membrane beta-barrel protein [Gemmatimonadaceae bacterium]|nr:outer membrane beta-barrel protein [Gemmatimonadaceae bacterium]